jgi:hypothetical protein
MVDPSRVAVQPGSARTSANSKPAGTVAATSITGLSSMSTPTVITLSLLRATSTGWLHEWAPAGLTVVAASTSATMRSMRRIGITVAVAIVVLVASATPASAHTVAGVRASNYQTNLLAVQPPTPGIVVRVVELGSRLELTNKNPTDVIVIGYLDEPYLRVGPQGVFENVLSPAVYLNRTRTGGGHIPGDADATKPPQWRKVSSDPVARWHDHRIHFMGTQDPPQVRRAPHQRHVIEAEWRVPMKMVDQSIVVTGNLVYVPGPSPAPWIAVIAVSFVAAAVAGLTRRWRMVIAVLAAVIVVVDLAHASGVALAAADTGGKVTAFFRGSLYSFVAWAAGIWSVVLLRQRRTDGLFAAGFAGLLVAIAGGLVDIGDLTHSQVPFAGSAGLARALVALSLGLGLGVTAACGLALWRNQDAMMAREPEDEELEPPEDSLALDADA